MPQDELDEGQQTEAAADAATEAAEPSGAKPKKRRRRQKRGIIASVIVAIIVVGGAGVWVWHEDPSFCGAICHSPMETYPGTYYAEVGQPTTDAYGNRVADAGAMLAATHREADENCLSCHSPVIAQQVSEGTHWISGDYEYPLEERDLVRLLEASTEPDGASASGQEFCTRDACHTNADGSTPTINQMAELVRDRYPGRNPHQVPVNNSHQLIFNNEFTCSDCHKAHRASVLVCTQCHDDMALPDGWVSAQQGTQIKEVSGI